MARYDVSNRGSDQHMQWAKRLGRAKRAEHSQSNATQLVIYGKVTNVGFRDFIVRRATKAGLRGWVRNRSDGSVEVVAADGSGVDELVQACHEGPRSARVERVVSARIQVDRLRREFIRKRQLELVDDPAVAEAYGELGIDAGGEAFAPLHKAGLLSPRSAQSIALARKYWEDRWQERIDPALHIAFENMTGRFDERVVPPVQYRRLQRRFNGNAATKRAYEDKSLYPYLVRTDRQPLNYLRRINGRYFDPQNRVVEVDIFGLLAEQCDRAIVKPSRAANGRDVKMLKVADDGEFTLDGRELAQVDLEAMYGKNFIVQEVVEQHPTMARAHSQSINTLRMLTLRLGAEVQHVMTFARFGTGGRVNDNAGTGGICLGVQEDGEFLPTGVDEGAQAYVQHPTTGVKFSDLDAVPNYSDFVKFVVEMHQDLPYYDLVSWDIAVGKDGQPVFIEHNFAGAMWIYQLAARRPVFGELTDDVLSYAKT
jgi:acylphosphatase